jgi:hypothetical protein
MTAATVARPLYENDASRTAEQRIAQIVSDKWKCSLIKLPRSYVLDYVAERNGKLTCWVEIKQRNFKFGEYVDYTISLHKYMDMLTYVEKTGLPALLVVEFSDGLIYWHLATRPCVVGIGGRTDRNDPQDVEPVARIAWAEFKELMGR